MKILIYDINYSPELTGVGKYTGEMGSWLSQRGHTVRVITAMPYYPEWKVHEAYRGKFWFTEMIDGAVINRCPFYVPQKVTSLTRIIHELSFVTSSLPYWVDVCLSEKHDVMLCVAPPFHIGLLPTLYAKLKGVPLWCHIQDLQIDMAKELGMLKNKRFLDIMFQVERFIFKQCAVISTISEGMVRKISEKNITQAEPVFFPNWVDDKQIRPLGKQDSLREEFGFSATDKVVLYSGSLGEKQGLELIIDSARHFAPRKEIKFLICGSGGGKDRLETLVKQYRLTNVSFNPLQPYEKLSALLSTADVHLVLQKKSASDLVLPSKLTSILAAGGCALVSAVPGTTLYDVISDYQMGILIEPESAHSLQTGIEKALNTDVTAYKQNARRYAQSYLGKEIILQKFEQKLLALQTGVPERLLA